jgi:phosphatidylinositol alpha-1,6-mannosyltransferase
MKAYLLSIIRYLYSMNILFLSKSYPPTLGGIEKQNYELAQALKEDNNVTIIANTRGKQFLPFFLPYVLIKSLLQLKKHDAVLVGDGVLSPIALILSLFAPKKIYASVIHGLDITFAQKKTLFGKIYRCINIPSLKQLDTLIAVGNETIERAVEAGIPREKCIFIPNGIYAQNVIAKRSRADLEKLLERDLSGKYVILRIGRYVEHKGVEWFIRNVMTLLGDDIIFVGAGGVVTSGKTGDSDFYPRCEEAVKENNLESRVHLLKNLPWKDMQTLINTADIVVSPNIRVKGSMEGFGINAIEAGVCERPVIASNLDGLKDAIKHNVSGILIEPENPQAYTKSIHELLNDKEKRRSLGKSARKYILQNFTWKNIAKQYIQALHKKRN